MEVTPELLQAQLVWEAEGRDNRIEAFLARQTELCDTARGDLTPSGQAITKSCTVDLGEYIHAVVRDKLSHSSSAPLARLVQLAALSFVEGVKVHSYEKVAMIAIKVLLRSLLIDDMHTSRTKMINEIGVALEADLKCILFKYNHPDVYARMEDAWSRQNLESHTRRLAQINTRFREFDMDWNNWEQQHRTAAGLIVFNCMEQVMSHVFRTTYKHNRQGRPQRFIEPRSHFAEWSNEVNTWRAQLSSVCMPLMIPPRDWNEDNLESGVYYTFAGSKDIALVKKKGKWSRDYIHKNTPKAHMKALNVLQQTQWKINLPVLKVQNKLFIHNLGGLPRKRDDLDMPFPEHLAGKSNEQLTDDELMEKRRWKHKRSELYQTEQERLGKTLAYTNIHKQGLKMRNWAGVFFGYNCCFRGRAYSLSTGISPQGCDTGRGLLQLAHGKEITEEGIYWASLTLSGKFGYDSTCIDDRLQWVKEREPWFKAINEDPVGMRKEWLQADKPFMFLAQCMEWAKTDYGRNPRAVTNMLAYIDGKCNGLQHYSAMLKDEVGARATNLVATNAPEDIYGEVARVCTELMKPHSADNAVGWWLKLQINRKCAKRPVMTLPYGATQFSARDYIMEYLRENRILLQSLGIPTETNALSAMVKCIAPYLWQAIHQVVNSALIGMKFIQQTAKKALLDEGHIKWLSLIGFPVYQGYKEVTAKPVYSELMGRTFVNMYVEGGEPDNRRHRNGIAPNMIHTQDSTHLVLVTNGMHDRTGSVDYGMTHDEYGAHPSLMNDMQHVTRDSFRWMYKHDILRDWVTQLGQDVEGIPEYGNYDVNEIMNAKYAFL